MRRLLVAVAVFGLWAAPAHASTYSRLLRIYQSTGSIPPCEFSGAQLQGVLSGTDTYAAQYFADFTNAIRAALSQRAAGACEPHQASAAPVRAARHAPLHLGPVIASTSSGVPAPLLLLAALGGLFLLAGAVAGAARVRGWDPAWAVSWRHAWAEAEFRVGATWHEFADWLRSRD